jgi:hypothetical protein
MIAPRVSSSQPPLSLPNVMNEGGPFGLGFWPVSRRSASAHRKRLVRRAR